MHKSTLRFETSVTGIEEKFSSVSVPNASYNRADPTSKYYIIDQRSLGWFVMIAELGIAIRVGDKKPPDINMNCLVEIIIHPVGEPSECVESSSNRPTPPQTNTPSIKTSTTPAAASETQSYEEKPR